MAKFLEPLSSKKSFSMQPMHLNSAQKRAVEIIDKPILVLAGAGAGKTRVITSKIIHLIFNHEVDPQDILAITFTNKAAGEMKDRVEAGLALKEKNKLLIKTFHSWGVFFLRNFIHFLPPYKNNFSIIDEEDKKKIVKDLISKETKVVHSELKTTLRLFSFFKNDLLYGEEEDFARKIKPYFKPKFFSFDLKKVYLEYVSFLAKANLLDFDDLIGLTLKLRDNEVCARYLLNRWRYVLVDEYQDTNYCQEKIIDWFVKSESILTLVGDDHQSIYSFRGANFENIFNFSKKYPNTKIIKLEENYRSKQAILNLANSIIAKNKVAYKKKLFSDLGLGETPIYCQFKSEKAEAQWVAEKIASLKDQGTSLKKTAIFFRTNYQSRSVEEALVKQEIPYKVIGGISFYQRKEIKNVLAYLKLLLNPLDQNAFLRIVNLPPRNLGVKSIEKILELNASNENDFSKSLLKTVELKLPKKSTLGLEEFKSFFFQAQEKISAGENFTTFIEFIINQSGLREYYTNIKDSYEREQSLGYLDEFTNSISYQYLESGSNDLKENLTEFIEKISLLENFSNKESKESEGNFANLLTIHNAKGLEFDFVFIIGLEEGVFPHFLSFEEEGQIEEERRIFYVGVTRAKKNLALTSSEFKSKQGRWEFHYPSRFVKEINDDLLKKMNFSNQAYSYFF